jgi:spermidine/putrescine transport system substrate-binding protein
MKQLPLLVFAVLAAAGALFAAPVAAQDAVEPWVCPPEFAGQHINVFNWTTYIAETTMDGFAAACGVTYTYDNYDSDESMITLIRQGNPGFDIIVPSDYAVPLMIEEELLLPLDHALLPNLDNLDPDLRQAPFDPDSTYTVPYLWGTFGIGYSTVRVTEPVTSWTQFFEHDGPVAWADDPRSMFAIALLMIGADPNTRDAADIEAAADFLIANSSNALVIAADDGQELLARGEVDMAFEYNGDVYQLILDCACDDFAFAVPEEGTGISAGFIAIPLGARNPELAHAFIDYVLNPQVGADIANYTAYPTPNQAAVDLGLIDPDQLNDGGIYPTGAARDNLFYVEYQGDDIDSLMNAAWDEIKIRVGR